MIQPNLWNGCNYSLRFVILNSFLSSSPPSDLQHGFDPIVWLQRHVSTAQWTPINDSMSNGNAHPICWMARSMCCHRCPANSCISLPSRRQHDRSTSAETTSNRQVARKSPRSLARSLTRLTAPRDFHTTAAFALVRYLPFTHPTLSLLRSLTAHKNSHRAINHVVRTPQAALRV